MRVRGEHLEARRAALAITSQEGDCEALEEVVCGDGGVAVATATKVSRNCLKVCDGVCLPPTKSLDSEWHEVNSRVVAPFEVAGHFPLFGCLEETSPDRGPSL
jgi:hypothetical protein